MKGSNQVWEEVEFDTDWLHDFGHAEIGADGKVKPINTDGLKW